ncbi:aldo/keto reductase [Promicromonospora sp. NPDC050880]|uniref:aldo/keto reductase n=1 Tax=Promicromonospora sp. NPDC050880 TaxID=3364406 RepID=UPI0037A709B8
MRYKILGRHHGLRVSDHVLGTAGFGSSPTATGLEGARAIFEAFVGAGGTTFDVSNIYRDGEAETVLGSLLGRDRDDYVLIAKYTGSRAVPVRPGTTGNSRRTMVRSLEQTLTRLGTDHVDVFMPHFSDGITPTSEILEGLDDLRRAGKIRYGGFSGFPAWRVAGAAVRSELAGRRLVVGIETEYSLAERSAERELFPMAEAHGLGVLLYSPLAGGLLTGKYRRGESGRLGAPGPTAGGGRADAVLDAVLAVAEETGTGPVQVALAWLRGRGDRARTTMIPIVGPRTPAHLESYLAASDLDLTPEQYRRLDEVSAVRLGVPHDEVAGALAHGVDGDRSRLDLPDVPAA